MVRLAGMSKEVGFDPTFDVAPDVPFDLVEAQREAIVAPLRPRPGAAIEVDGRVVDDDDVLARLAPVIADGSVRPDDESWLRGVFDAAVADFSGDDAMPIDMTHVVCAAGRAGLPLPSASIIYTVATDVIPSARDLIGASGARKREGDAFAASLAFALRPPVLGFRFEDADEFEAFRDDAVAEAAASGLGARAMSEIARFGDLTLDGLTLTLSIGNAGASLAPLSFPRFIVSALRRRVREREATGRVGILPMSMRETLRPSAIALVNVSAHARASAACVAREWNDVRLALALRPRILSLSRMESLTRVVRDADRMISAGRRDGDGRIEDVSSGSESLSLRRPGRAEIASAVAALASRSPDARESSNLQRRMKRTFARPSRRHPDDFMIPGSIGSMVRKRDVHLYVDTSGSISQEDWEREATLIAILARRLQIDMFLTTFSHYMSPTLRLPVRNLGADGVLRLLRAMPKANGGTDFAQIWRFIEASARRREELSLVISDMEVEMPSEWIRHPRNLYYLPCSGVDEDRLLENARTFVNSALHDDANVRAHLLM